jgi:hypothetical protein
MQAINPVTGEYGPKAYFNNDWEESPTIPVDEKGEALDDLSFVIATGAYSFAMIGNGSQSYDGSDEPDDLGDYTHIASFFEVDPDTLEITRRLFVTTESDSTPRRSPARRGGPRATRLSRRPTSLCWLNGRLVALVTRWRWCPRVAGSVPVRAMTA